MPTAALYVYSADATLTDQIRTVANFAAEQDIQITCIYSDICERTQPLEGRTGFERLFSESNLGLFDTVLVESASTLGNNPVELARCRWILRFSGVELRTVSPDPFPDSEADLAALLGGIIAYCERLLARVSST